jgi:hypothetical protein
MKRILLILFFIFISPRIMAQIGENRDFWITTESDFAKRISKGRDVTLRRYIVVPDFDKNFKNILETTDEYAVLAKFSFMLRRNKTAWIDKYIENHVNKSEVNDLIKGLYYFSKKEYGNALIYLEQDNDNKYIFLKEVLIADCRYELKDFKDSKNSIELFQSSMDKASNDLEKIIVSNRIKHIRYK